MSRYIELKELITAIRLINGSKNSMYADNKELLFTGGFAVPAENTVVIASAIGVEFITHNGYGSAFDPVTKLEPLKTGFMGRINDMCVYSLPHADVDLEFGHMFWLVKFPFVFEPFLGPDNPIMPFVECKLKIVQ